MPKSFLYIFLFFTFFLNVLLLDGDPSPIKRWGDVADEGFWVYNARVDNIFQNYTDDDMEMSKFGAPLFNIITFHVFEILGISLFSARITNLFSFIILVVFLLFLIRKYFDAKYSLHCVALFCLTHEILMFVRWGTPIITMILFQFINAINFSLLI